MKRHRWIIPSSANKYGLMQTAMRAKYELPFSKVVRALLLNSPIVCVYAKLKKKHTHTLAIRMKSKTIDVLKAERK